MAKDIYESIGNRFICRNVTGKAIVKLLPRSAAIVAICPAGGKIQYDGCKTFVDNKLVDCRNQLF